MSDVAIFKNGDPPPCPDAFNLAAYVLGAADRTPDKPALECLSAPGKVSEHWTFGALRQRVQEIAGGLAANGLKRGDKLILRIGHSSHFPVFFLAAAGMGAVPVPTSAQLTSFEIDRIIDDLGDAAMIICDRNLSPPSVEIATYAPDDIALGAPLPFAATQKDDPGYIVYTSGSSGQAKGVVHAHRAVWARRMMWDGWYGLTNDDRLLHAGAFNWTFTLGTGLMDPWAIGATALVYTGPADRHIWSELVHAHSATLFAAAPGVFRQQLTSSRNISADFMTLRHALSAGEAMPEQVRRDWEDRTGADLHEALGMSEVSTYVSGRPGEPLFPGTMGKPQPGRHVAVLKDGVPVAWGEGGILAVHHTDPGLMLGYYRKNNVPHLPLNNGWFESGDRVSMAKDGGLTYLGRADNLITAGGYRVAPEEIEAALLKQKGVSEAAVIPIEVKPGTRIIAAFIAGSDRLDLAALRTDISHTLAAYKTPRHYQQIDALPRRANGKLDRTALAELWEPHD